MSRHHRRAGYSNKRLQTWIVAIAAVTILVVFGSAGGYLFFTKRATDPLTGCPTDHFGSVTAALIDLTDPINPTQAAALRNALLAVRDSVPKFGRFEIYSLKVMTAETLQPLFAGCSPGSGKDVDSRLYGNPELADRLWQKDFATKVDAVVDDLLGVSASADSPILEGIQSVAVTAFGRPIAEQAAAKRLVVISDMIQHTPELSMYQGAPVFTQFNATQYYLRVKPFLRGALVDIYLIVRETRRNVQQPPLYKFWEEYFAASDGFLRNWEPMQ